MTVIAVVFLTAVGVSLVVRGWVACNDYEEWRADFDHWAWTSWSQMFAGVVLLMLAASLP